MAELRVGSATHPGQTGRNNEDNLVVTDRLFVVADGMGGHAAGEVASQIAVDRIGELLGGPEMPTALDVVEAIRAANGDIFRAAIANPEQAGMGTTITAVGVIADSHAGRAAPQAEVDPGATDAERLASAATTDADGTQTGNGDDGEPGDVTPIVPAVPSEALVIANVGDSRTYLFRHGRLRRVTVDHNYVQELVATGHITDEEARTHPRRNIITRTLGIEPDVKVDWWTLPLIRGDRFVLCSDGLVDEVHDRDITTTVAELADPQACAERLVDQANAAGGRDNITVIVLDVLAGDEPPDPTQEVDVVPEWPDPMAGPTPAGPLSLLTDSPDADIAVAGANSTGDHATDDAADGDPTPPAMPGAMPPAPGTSPDANGGRRRNLKRFAIGIAAAAILIVGFVVFSAWARSGYFVAFNDDDEAIIFQGRPGGVLWINPTAKSQSGPSRDDLDPAKVADIDDETRFDSLADAAEFIREAVTTTTTTTTTTVPPTTTTAPRSTTTTSGDDDAKEP